MNASFKTLDTLASVDIFKAKDKKELLVGHPFYLDYQKAQILTCDKWKENVDGVPQGSFLLAFYRNPLHNNVQEEAILLRALKPCPIPSDQDMIASKIQFDKENIDIFELDSKGHNLDEFTRFEFSFSGIECSVLGSFYKNEKGETEFGADVANFYSSHYYTVYKLTGKYLEYTVNRPDDRSILSLDSNFPIGGVRYSSSKKDKYSSSEAKVYLNTNDILGKRTALFGMTRTGKSNTVKKLIEATETLSKEADFELGKTKEGFEQSAKPFKDEKPKYPVGQIIFDINGEYANKNLQDGTAIFEMYGTEKVTRYSVVDKPDFEVMKINFYSQLEAGLDLIRGYFKQFGKQSDYIEDFLAISLEKPNDPAEYTRYWRKVAAYKCCLNAAGFSPSKDYTVTFTGNIKELDSKIKFEEQIISPKDKVSLNLATIWFTQVWKNYNEWDYLKNYEEKNGRPWADNDLKAILRFLTQFRHPNEKGQVSGFIILKPIRKYHSLKANEKFELEICKLLNQGKIVIADLSQGDPEIQRLYSERICQAVFQRAMNNFIEAKPNNFIQFYFEEAHNLFPKKDDKDLSQIYNRIAKEGAKLNLGLIYATQEVSSISSNILKNTQNWFIAHLNNEDEIKELRKFYDFKDFADSLIRFSAKNDKGFVRMKTYSNPFIVPVQIDLFEKNKGNGDK